MNFHTLSYLGIIKRAKFLSNNILSIYILMLVVVLRNSKVNWKMFVKNFSSTDFNLSLWFSVRTAKM